MWLYGSFLVYDHIYVRVDRLAISQDDVESASLALEDASGMGASPEEIHHMCLIQVLMSYINSSVSLFLQAISCILYTIL